MTDNMTDVMVDIETTGTNPDRTAILQIGAVKFNAHTREVSPDFFNRSLTIPGHRSWDTETMNWWTQQKAGVLSEIMNAAEPHRDVINSFAEWAYPMHHLRFWAKPTTFDFMFISSYFKDMDIVNPFSYRTAVDMNSFLAGKYFPEEAPHIQVTHTGDAHNALQDCFWQLKLLFAHLDGEGETK